MASRCVAAISDLNPEIVARGEAKGCYQGVKGSLASQTHPFFEIGRWGGSLVNQVDFFVPAKEFGRRCWYAN